MTHGVSRVKPEVLFYGKGWRVMRQCFHEAITADLERRCVRPAGNVAFELCVRSSILIFTAAMTAFIGSACKWRDHLVRFLSPSFHSPSLNRLFQKVRKSYDVPLVVSPALYPATDLVRGWGLDGCTWGSKPRYESRINPINCCVLTDCKIAMSSSPVV